MLSFSKNLDNVSNNIANMNTPGFKGSDTFYRSLTTGDSALGTQVSGQEQRFARGDIRQTGNDSDLAINGEGYFILLDNGESRYTRAGQFTLNEQNQLVDRVTGNQVAAINSNGQLQAVDLSNQRVLAPSATTALNFTGNLSADMTTVNVDGLSVFNGLGEQQNLNFAFTNTNSTTSGSWQVVVSDGNGNTLTTQTIQFGADGTPVAGSNSFTVTLTDSQGGTDNVTINFGTAGSFAGATSVAGGDTSTISGVAADGNAIGALTSVSFNAQGQIQLNYSNGETADGPTLAIASFTDQSVLDILEGSVFTSSDNSGLTIGEAGSGSRGAIASGNIELSNVDLSREFADMIVIQRGYQASSRILNVANQLLDQLYENTRG